MAIMTNKDLIERMYELYRQPNRYGSGGNNWSTWLGSYWYVDCNCSIKAILWGGRFTDDRKGRAHAGCNYGSNGIPDTTPDGFLSLGQVSSDFKNIKPGEVVIMQGRSHMGLYVGNGKVLEVTPAWTGGNPGCQLSDCGSNGERSKNGVQIYNWTHHIKLNCISYGVPIGEYKIEDIGEDYVKVSFKPSDNSNNAYDWCCYKLNDDEWKNMPLDNTIKNLQPNTSYKIAIKLRNSGTDQWEESQALDFTTKEAPKETQETPLIDEKPQDSTITLETPKTPENEPQKQEIEHNAVKPNKKNKFLDIIIKILKYIVKIINGGK